LAQGESSRLQNGYSEKPSRDLGSATYFFLFPFTGSFVYEFFDDGWTDYEEPSFAMVQCCAFQFTEEIEASFLGDPLPTIL